MHSIFENLFGKIFSYIGTYFQCMSIDLSMCYRGVSWMNFPLCYSFLCFVLGINSCTLCLMIAEEWNFKLHNNILFISYLQSLNIYIYNVIQYMHVKSNHPPNIIKQIPKTIKNCLSQFYSNEEIFNESAPFYADKLNQSGYHQKFKYNPVKTKTHNKLNHKKNIIWFNPLFSRNVSKKIGKHFLNLLDKHLLQNHRLHKIFNRNSVKVRYSCTKNMKTIINNHN